MNRLLLVLAMTLTFMAPGAPWEPEPAHAQTQDQTALQRIRSTIQSKGRARVIVELRLPAGQHVPEGLLGSQAAVGLQRQDIANAGAKVLSRVLPTGARVVHKFDSLPFVALEVDSAGLAQLQASGLDVNRIMEDEPRHPLLFQSGPLVEAPEAWAAGFDGTGWAVAIIDSGVESSHPFLAGKVVSEACYVSGGGCPGGVSSVTGTNSALPINSTRYHGTHVAGVAAGNAPNAVPAPPAPMTNTSSGIAKGAQIIAINVFGPFSVASTSDVMAALSRVFALRSSFNIAAANLSLGSDGVTNLSCNSDPMKTVIDQLRSVKIATVAASGNDYTTSGMNSPACISSAVSVGSVDKTNVVSSFSNVGAFLSLFAPGGNGFGQDIYASLLNGTYGPLAGTSRSAPHVTGAWAVLKQAAPTATVPEILTALQNSGVPVTDTRPGGSYTKPSIRIGQALALLVPLPASVSPTTAGIGATLNVVITGSNFQLGANASFGTGVTVNSMTRNSSTQLTANLTIQANAAPGSRNVTVTNSDGRFATLPSAFVVTAPVPTITTISPSPVTVGGGNFTLTVNGANFASNSIVRLNGTDRSTTFVTSSQLRASILASDIAAAGTQSVAVFTPGGGTTSPAILNVNYPAPALASISPSTLAAWGPAFTLTANGTTFVSGSVVQVNGTPRPTTFVSPTQLTAAIPAGDRATTATSLTITVTTPAPGGGTTAARTLTLTQPAITVSATNVPPNSSVTATLTNSPGGSTDWLALALVGAPTTSYLQYVYVPSLPGTATKTWSIPMPAALGQYEFRLYLNNSYVIAATSPPVTVASISPTPSIASLAPAGVAAGSAGFALTVTGSGFVAGTTATVGGQPRPVTFNSATQVTIAVLTSDVATQGTVPVQVTNPAACVGGLCASNAVPLVVTPPPPAPTLSGISPTTVAAGGPAFTLTATGANFAGNSVVQINNSPRTTTFVSATQLTATILASDIAASGTPTITVVTPAPGGGTSAAQLLTVTGPALAVSASTAPPGGSITATLTNSPGGSTDWLTLALVGAPTTSYLQYVYVPSLPGTATKTWSIPMPAALGQYEFRLYLNNSYVIAATSPPVTVASISPTPSIASLAPAGVAAGSAGFALTVTGSGFVAGTTATVGGQPRPVTFNSATQVTIAVLTSDVATQGTVPVQVTNPAACVGGLCASNAVPLVVTPPPPAPTLSGISPTTVAAGGPAFTLTATGANFAGNSVVQINNSPRTTTFVSATQLTATILASDIAASGTPTITVVTPAPGGGTSAAQLLTVTGPALAVSASTAPPGGSITATLTNSPGGSTDWLALALVGAPTTSYLQYVYVPSLPGTATKTWSIPMPAALGQYEFRLYLNNSYVIAATSPPVTVASISPTPSIASLAPAGVAAGSAGFALTVTGSGFVAGTTATVGGQPRPVTFNSATQVTIAVLTSDVATQGTVPVQVTNPAACVGGLCASNAVPLVVTPPPPAPTLSGISPTTVAAGGPAFTLTATGANFAGNSVVQINNSPRTTTFVSATQLTATILASDIAASGTPTITVVTPAPGGGTSAAQLLTVTGPALAVSASTAPPGGSITATLTNSPGGSTDWLALALVGAPTTSYLQYVYVPSLPGTATKTWSIPMPAALGQYEFRLYLNNSYVIAATSPPVTVASISPTPSIASLAPAGVAAGSAGFALTVTGSGFVAGTTATVGGQPRPVTFNSATQVTIAVLTSDVATQGTVPVQVTNPAACVGGLCASNAVPLVVTPPPPAPTLSGISPTTVAAGGPAFTLTATGANFAGNSVVQINNSPRTTTFVSATQLTATILASDIAASGTPTITVVTPAPGGGTSAAQLLTVTGPALAVSASNTLGGQSITTTLTIAPGGASDWLGLAAVGAPNTSYLQYVYVGAGVTNRSWTVSMPNTGGSYEFRLYLNNSYTITAASPAVAVTQDIRGTYSVSSTLTQTSCADAGRNGTLSLPGTLTVTAQTGGTFSGSATLSVTQFGVTATTDITLSGTVLPTASNNISGVFTYEVRENGVLTRSGNGTVVGTAIPNRLTLTVDAQDSSLETCHTAGPITATR